MVTESEVLPEMSPAEVVLEPFVPMPNENLTLDNSGFDYTGYEPIDFTPEYYEKIMRLFTSSKGKKRRVESKDGQSVIFTPEKAFAVEAADQFSALYPGFGTYQELRDGTSKFAPGIKLTDNQILKSLTTMEDRGFLEAFGRRSLENVPSVAAFAGAAKATSEFTKKLPRFPRTGIKPIDFVGAVYEGAKAVAPIVTGTVASVFSSPLGQEAADYIIGKEALPTPKTYSTMRAAEAGADVVGFSGLLLGADKIINNNLKDYLVNSLSKDKNLFGRDFDFSDAMEKSLGKQLKNAKKLTGVTSDGLRRRKGVQYEGPPIVNDMFERGVAAVLEGKTAPSSLLRLHALEQIIKKSAKDQRNNLPLFAFYEALAAGGAIVGTGMAAESSPFGGMETVGELTGSVASPLLFGELSSVFVKQAVKPVVDVMRGVFDGGFKGASEVLIDKGKLAKARRGFSEIRKELEKFGNLDNPEDIENLINLLNKNASLNGVKQTAAQATKNPVLLAMEDTLKKQFDFLGKQQVEAKLAELRIAQAAVDALYRNQDTEFGKEALIAAAQLEESIFNQFLSARLLNAETNLFNSVNQLAKSKRTNVSDMSVIGSRVEVSKPTAGGLQSLDNADIILLSEKLQDVQVAQKKIARNQQESLYKQVGNLDVMFYEDNGNLATLPKFVRFFEDEGILDKSDVAEDLKNLIQFTDQVKSQFTPEGLREETSVLLDIVGNPQKLSTSKEQIESLPLSVLNTRRKEALNIARDGTKSPETRRLAGMFAEAIQDDIQNMEDFGADLVDENKLKALKTANAYSRAFYDVYLRSYLGKALSQGKQGEYRLALESFGNILGANADLNAVRIADIQGAGQFALANNLDSAQAGVDSVNGVIDRMIRSARASSVDPITKRIDTKKLQEWMDKNSRLEETFPDIFADLRDVQTQKSLLEVAEDFDSTALSEAKKQVNFTSLLRNAKGEIRSNPTDAVAEAFAPGADQFERLEALVNVLPKKGDDVKKTIYYVTNEETGLTSTFFDKKSARKYLDLAKAAGGTFKQTQKTIEVNRESAVEGLKSSIFEYFVLGRPTPRADATVERSGFNPEVIYNNLFERKFDTVKGRLSARRGPRSTTLADYLKNKGIFTQRDIDTAKTALQELAKANTVDAVEGLTVDLAEAKPILDFALSITGSAIGTRSQSLITGGNAGPGSIIAAGKGAEAMRNIALRIPESQKMLFTAQLLQDPKLLARMMREYTDDPTNQRGLIGSIGNYLKYKGFVVLPTRGFTASRDESLREVEEELPSNEEESQVIPSVPATNQRASLIPPTVTPTNRQAVDPRRAAAPAPIVPNNVSQPATQSRYAALFPNDPISSMIRNREGIGSLI